MGVVAVHPAAYVATVARWPIGAAVWLPFEKKQVKINEKKRGGRVLPKTPPPILGSVGLVQIIIFCETVCERVETPYVRVIVFLFVSWGSKAVKIGIVIIGGCGMIANLMKNANQGFVAALSGGIVSGVCSTTCKKKLIVFEDCTTTCGKMVIVFLIVSVVSFFLHFDCMGACFLDQEMSFVISDPPLPPPSLS